MRVSITARARYDLSEIFDRIAPDSSSAAIKYVRVLRTKAFGLGNFPRKHPVRADLPGAPRMVPCGSHVILYRIVGSRVEVLRFMHGARDLPDVLDEG